MRGDCQLGGIKITGYATQAGRYCAIIGGDYSVTGENGSEQEQGECSFKSGQNCDVWKLFNGECSPST